MEDSPEPVVEDNTDDKWKYFKNCLDALDGTHIKVTVPTSLKGRYRSRKADIVTNVLGVCAPDMQFIYVLLDGRARHTMVVCFEMLSPGQMGYVSLKVATTLLMLATQMQMDF